MSNPFHFPQIESHLPELMPFVTDLAQVYQRGEITVWPAMAKRVQTFFTPEMMAKVEAVAPGWGEMSAYAGGLTLVHVMCVFTGLLLSPEYQGAAPEQQALMKWIVLFHDLTKKVQNGQRDQTHGFRSAARAGEILPRLGFPVADGGMVRLKRWAALTSTATVKQVEGGDEVQDNRKLPGIIQGIEEIFGRNTPAALVIKTVLLHMSLTVVKAWPQTAPLTEVETRRYVDRALLPLLKMMMLADNDGWVLFDPPAKEAYRRETLRVFEVMEGLIRS